LLPGEEPCCGIIYHAPEGIHYEINRESLPAELEGILSHQEYIVFFESVGNFIIYFEYYFITFFTKLHKINKAITETAVPLCPCYLTLLGYLCATYICTCKRVAKIMEILSDFNEKFNSRNLYWYKNIFNKFERKKKQSKMLHF
jgi:hypothetical protein